MTSAGLDHWVKLFASHLLSCLSLWNRENSAWSLPSNGTDGTDRLEKSDSYILTIPRFYKHRAETKQLWLVWNPTSGQTNSREAHCSNVQSSGDLQFRVEQLLKNFGVIATSVLGNININNNMNINLTSEELENPEKYHERERKRNAMKCQEHNSFRALTIKRSNNCLTMIICTLHLFNSSLELTVCNFFIFLGNQSELKNLLRNMLCVSSKGIWFHF